MKDVEKFKELLEEISRRIDKLRKDERLCSLQYIKQESLEIRKLKEEIIGMYSEAIKKLEEQQEELEYYGAREQDRYLQEPMEV